MCYVGRHVNGKSYVLLRLAPMGLGWGGGFRGVGPVVSLRSEDMQRNGLSIALGAMRDPFAAGAPGPSLAELLKLKRYHTFVAITLWGPSRLKLEVSPQHARRGWRFTRWPEETRTIRLPTENARFTKVLDRALDVAS
jgi:hypothetical protein